MNAEDRCFCELAPLYALNLLDESDRRWVEEQITDNPELAAELADYQATANVLPYAAPPEPMAATLKDRLLQRLAQESTPDTAAIAPSATIDQFEPSPTTPTPPADSPTRELSVDGQQESSRSRVVPFQRRRGVWRQAAGAVAVLVAIALLADNYRLRQNAQADRAIVATLQQPGSVVYTLKGTDKAATASGSLVVNASNQAAVALVQNLPALPSGKAYRLWAVPKGATKPTYCGQFNNTRTGTVRWSLPEAVCSTSVAQMLITAESASDPPIPAGPLVMKSAS